MLSINAAFLLFGIYHFKRNVASLRNKRTCYVRCQSSGTDVATFFGATVSSHFVAAVRSGVALGVPSF